MNRIFGTFWIVFSWISVLIPLGAVLALLLFLLKPGLAVLNPYLFFGDVPFWDAVTGRIPVWDGIWPAVVGTIYLVCLSTAMAIPLGVASGIYLAEYASGSLKAFLNFSLDLLAGIPSIVMGLFGFALILMLKKFFLPLANTCLLLSAVCLALLVLPYLVKTTRTTLEQTSASLRLVGPSLGLTHWQNIFYILLPSASRGILSGVILALGRAAEDTAVIMLTGVVTGAGLPRGLTDKYEALPFNIYYLAAEYRTVEELNQGFGSAVVLLILTSLIFLSAHLFQRSLEKRWKSGRTNSLTAR